MLPEAHVGAVRQDDPPTPLQVECVRRAQEALRQGGFDWMADQLNVCLARPVRRCTREGWWETKSADLDVAMKAARAL